MQVLGIERIRREMGELRTPFNTQGDLHPAGALVEQAAPLRQTHAVNWPAEEIEIGLRHEALVGSGQGSIGGIGREGQVAARVMETSPPAAGPAKLPIKLDAKL